jgi:hypothetical protein
VTWINGTTGLSGTVSAGNSLVGGARLESLLISSDIRVTPLSNGNYVVASPRWTNGSAPYAGAATWGNGNTGISGVISAANSLVGSLETDSVGDVTALSNGNYVVSSIYWSNGATAQVGAVTWGNGTTGVKGAVSASNSLIGPTAHDNIGLTVAALNNGNYVVGSANWQNASGTTVGAATWANGQSGLKGIVSPANSLVGSSPYDGVGTHIVALVNGNYVVVSPTWSNGEHMSAGAVTFGNGTKPIAGTVSASNSLVGTTNGDIVGEEGVVALTNGNYVVASAEWHNGDVYRAGAVTWGNGATGIAGNVSASNSLVGAMPGASVGYGGVTALSNGNYVTVSPNWYATANGGTGAATWGNGSSGTVGVVSASNSLVGSANDDSVGSGGVVALSNGDYVVVSPRWEGQSGAAGAVTWANGSTVTAGAVSAANSMTSPFWYIDKVTALTRGNYIVEAPSDPGAMAIGNGSSTSIGFMNPNNSLVADNDVGFQDIGSGGVQTFADGNFAIFTPNCTGGTVAYAGCVTLANDEAPLTGNIHDSNSVFGATSIAGTQLVYGYDLSHHQLVVGRPADNIVSLLKAPSLSGSAVNMNQHGITGSWFNPATGGQGLEIEVFPDFPAAGQGILSAGWFTFDVTAAGGKRWYVLQGTATSDGTPAQLAIATSYGGNFDALPAVPGSVVGSATLRFDDCSSGALTYNFTDGSGRSGTIPLIRLIANVSCLPGGDNGNLAQDYLLSGNWFESATGGQGLIFDVNPIQNFLFAAWYTFATNGQQVGGPPSQRWYTLQTGDWVAGTTALDGIGIYTANGGEFDRPTPVTAERVGTANIAFSDCNTLSLAYTFTSGDNQGRSGTMHLTRVGPTPADCADQNYSPGSIAIPGN